MLPAQVSNKRTILRTRKLLADLQVDGISQVSLGEEVDGSAYRDADDARYRIGGFIEQTCNRRLRSAPDYQPSEEYEAYVAEITENCP